MFGRIIKSKSDDFIYLSISRRFVTWNECKSVRSKVVSIDGRFDGQKSIRSKTVTIA